MGEKTAAWGPSSATRTSVGTLDNSLLAPPQFSSLKEKLNPRMSELKGELSSRMSSLMYRWPSM